VGIPYYNGSWFDSRVFRIKGRNYEIENIYNIGDYG
jgi:hypothetical protein